MPVFSRTSFLADRLRMARAFVRGGRGVNVLKLGVSYQASRVLGRPWIWGLPAAVSIEPTTHCNLRCPQCPSGLRSFTRPTGTLPVEDYKGYLAQLADTVGYLTLYFQGEPYLHPDFTRLVRMAHDRGLYTVTSTNAHYLTPERAEQTVASGLSRLIISLDGTTQEAYGAYRIGGNLEKVLEGTARIVDARRRAQSRTPYLVAQFLVTSASEDQIDEARALAARLGVDELTYKTAQIYDFAQGHELMPRSTQASRYKPAATGAGYEINNPMPNRCWRMWHSQVITQAGKVVPCCFDKDATHELGDLKSTPLKDIWRGKGYGAFRRQVSRDRRAIDICQNCTEGMSVYARL